MKTLKDIKHWEEMKNQVICADCLEGMKLIPDKSIDLILTDPPYFEVKGEFDFVWDSFEDYLEFVEKCAIEFKRILKDNGSLLWFGHAKKIAYSQVIFDKYLDLINALVWEKPKLMVEMFDLRMFPERGHERALFYGAKEDFLQVKKYMRQQRKLCGMSASELKKTAGLPCNLKLIGMYFGDAQWQLPTEANYKKLQTTGYWKKPYEELRLEYEVLRRPWNNKKKLTDVLKYSQNGVRLDHPTQKPTNLVEDLLGCMSNNKAIVLDPFMGSWTTARACKDLGRDFIGFELSEEYCKIGEQRLRQEVMF
jgi:DNA modification methylase